MKEKPWVYDDDPIKDYYGLLSAADLEWLHEVLKAVDLNRVAFHLDADLAKNKVQFLDFCDYYNKPYQYELFKELVGDHYQVDGFLFWVPLNGSFGDGVNVFEQFEPLMIAKTPMHEMYLDTVARSALRLLGSGGFAVIDSSVNFIGISVEDQFMVALVDSNLSKKYDNYLKNWDLIDENVSAPEARMLKRIRTSINKKS